MKYLLLLLQKFRMYPLRCFAVSIAIGSCCFTALCFIQLIFIPGMLHEQHTLLEVIELILIGHLFGLFVCGPVVLSVHNILNLILNQNSMMIRKRSQWMEPITIIFGGFCFYLAALLSEIRWDQNWWEQLYNEALHTPVATWTYPTLITIGAMGLTGYLLLFVARLRPLPPLLTVLGLGGMYLGSGLCLVLFIQLCKHNWVLCVYLGNLLLIFLRVVKELIIQRKETPTCGEQKLRWIRLLLSKSRNLPLIGLLIALPLLGIALAILTLFGQEPDSIIQAWTQTSDWTLSQQVAPPNLPVDLHYLCTVAANGHQRLVKPIRMGKRHGHWVLVNRQLAVANAFEELLQQRLPRFHRFIRYIYDRYGYPIANHIRSPWASDVVWLIMKPAEWFFLTILYLFDPKPENRIAVQYPHAPIPTLDHT